MTAFVHDESPLRVRVAAGGAVSAIGGAAAAASPLVTGGIYWFGRAAAARAAAARARGVERLRHFLAGLVEDGVDVRAFVFSRIVDVDTAEDLRLLEAGR